MVVVMAPEATQADVDAVVQLVHAAGGEAFVSRGVSRTIIGLVGDVEQFGALNLRSYARRGRRRADLGALQAGQPGASPEPVGDHGGGRAGCPSARTPSP